VTGTPIKGHGSPGWRPDTAEQVARQLAALGSPRYDLVALPVERGEQLHRRVGVTADGVVRLVPWLEHLNAQGCEILVRPSAPAGLSYFGGVLQESLDLARQAGFESAAVLRAPGGAREVWMRGGADLPPPVQEIVDRELAGRLRPLGTPPRDGFGHLAGFASPHAQQELGLASALLVTLEEASGRVYGRFRELAAAGREGAAAQAVARQVERELGALGGGAPGPATARGAAAPAGGGEPAAGGGEPAGAAQGAAAGSPLARLMDLADREAELRGLADPGRPLAAADVDERLARWAAMQGTHEAALADLAGAAAGERLGTAEGRPGAARLAIEDRVVASFRAREQVRHELAERLGVRDLPPGLRTGAGGSIVDAPLDSELMAAYRQAQLQLAGTSDGAGWRRQVAAELELDGLEAALRAELRLLDRAHEGTSLLLERLEPRAESRPGGEEAQACGALTKALGDLERGQAPLAQRVAALAGERLERDLARLQEILAREPAAEAVARFTALLDERQRLAPRLAGVRRGEDPPLRAPASAPAPGEGRGQFERARRELLARPSPEAVETLRASWDGLRCGEQLAADRAASRELRQARRGLRRAGNDLMREGRGRAGLPPSPAELGPLRRALERYQAAESALARRLDGREGAAESRRPGVEWLCRRLRRGDLSPGTLARLQRAAGYEVRRGVTRGEPLAPATPAAPAASVHGAYVDYQDARATLLSRADPQNRRGGGREKPYLDLREAAARYQDAAAELHRQVQAAARSPESRALPPRYFLEHEAFAGQPQRAVATWAAHAAGRGVPASRIPEALARPARSRTASPRLLSPGHGIYLAGALSRLGLGGEQQLGHGR
jgi:hypothetical protein